MEHEDVVVLLIDELQQSCGVSHCRICHEAEFESCKSLEAPCACSGTVKFAHRDCIQRWCNEKGNTVCELCLQNYEPGYTVPVKDTKNIDTMTIRNSVEISRREHDPESQEPFVAVDNNIMECASSADRSAFCCRCVAFTVTIYLLLRHLVEILNNENDDVCPFTPLIIFMLRASGIVLPMYILYRGLTAIVTGIRQHYQRNSQEFDDDHDNSDDDGVDSGSGEDEFEDDHHLA